MSIPKDYILLSFTSLWKELGHRQRIKTSPSRLGTTDFYRIIMKNPSCFTRRVGRLLQIHVFLFMLVLFCVYFLAGMDVKDLQMQQGFPFTALQKAQLLACCTKHEKQIRSLHLSTSAAVWAHKKLIFVLMDTGQAAVLRAFVKGCAITCSLALFFLSLHLSLSQRTAEEQRARTCCLSLPLILVYF